MNEARSQKMGVSLLVRHDIAGLGRRRRLNLWIPDQGPDWKLEMEFSDLDLAVLLAYRLQDRWGAQLNVITTVKNEKDKDKAELFLSRMVDLARLPAKTMAMAADKDMEIFSENAPTADLNIFPLPEKLDADMLWKLRDATGSSCLFTRDSGLESALA